MALPQSLRLKKKQEITRVLQKGVFARVPGITLHYYLHGGGVSRFAFVVSKKTAPKSVVRNKIRRRASGWVQKNIRWLVPGFHAVFIFQKEASGFSSREFGRTVDAVVRKTRIAAFPS